MPRYNYHCVDDGEFTDWRPMSEASEPTACPTCGKAAPRGVSVPSLALMSPTNRKAHHVNERSADQPRVEKRPAGKSSGGHHPHSHGGHCSHAGHGRKPGHSHGPSRPWMIGH